MDYLGLMLLSSGQHKGDDDEAHADYDPTYNRRSDKSTYETW
jgi:hypothetical protein